MTVNFEKYHGNGNDFIIIDDRSENFDAGKNIIKRMCDRHFGIGADGLMLVRKSEVADFSMLYYNSDGALSTMCGNGGRCVAAFAYSKGIADKEMLFDAVDGFHKAEVNIVKNSEDLYNVSLQMIDVEEIKKGDFYYFLDTGSPHHVLFTDDVEEINVYEEGKKIRYGKQYSPDGTNVNFVKIDDDGIFVRTYERGVENETLSCGTGVTASAIATYLKTGKKPGKIKTLGGIFEVSFIYDDEKFTDIRLIGPAEKVFSGKIKL